MKVKILCGIVAVILVTTGAFLLFGCGKSNTPPSTPPADGSQSTLLAKPDNATPATWIATHPLVQEELSSLDVPTPGVVRRGRPGGDN